jgi:cytidylate kinase
MNCNIVTIARTAGAGGEDLGAALAKALDFRYVDIEIIDRAAEKAGVSAATIAQAESRKGLLARILENLALSNLAAPDAPMVAMDTIAGYEQVVIDVIKEVAAEGRVAIVAHGASVPLAGTTGLFRVLVTASAATRASRLPGGQKAVSDSDKARAEFLQRFYHVDHEQPTHYDLVINTDVLSTGQASAAVLAAIGA